MNRETKEIVTTSGKKVTIISYVTGRELNQIKRATYSGVGMTPSSELKPDGTPEKPKMEKISLTVQIDREEKIIDIAVVTFEGVPEGAADKVKDLPSEEYADVVKVIVSELKLNFQKAM